MCYFCNNVKKNKCEKDISKPLVTLQLTILTSQYALCPTCFVSFSHVSVDIVPTTSVAADSLADTRVTGTFYNNLLHIISWALNIKATN